MHPALIFAAVKAQYIIQQYKSATQEAMHEELLPGQKNTEQIIQGYLNN